MAPPGHAAPRIDPSPHPHPFPPDLTRAMARLVHNYFLSEACAYLPGLAATMEYRLMIDCTPEELEALLVRGWRRFGPTYFRPVCRNCAECVSLRIPVASFRPTKSQRRAFRRCQGLRVVTGPPAVDGERLAVYQAWHAEREAARGWRPTELDEEDYNLSFCFPHPCAREMAYYDGARLAAVGIVDETPHALSSVYFYYHPDYAPLSLGTASVLFEIEWARQRGRTHVYLGYRVLGCPSVAYKRHFGPHELLAPCRLALTDEPEWVPDNGPDGA